MERRIAKVEVDLPKHFHVVIWSEHPCLGLVASR